MTFEEVLEKLNKWSGEGYWDDLLYELELGDPIKESIVGQRRWFTEWEYVYEYQGRYLAVQVDRGSTEYQEDGEGVWAYEVQKVTKTITDYIRIPKAQA